MNQYKPSSELGDTPMTCRKHQLVSWPAGHSAVALASSLCPAQPLLTTCSSWPRWSRLSWGIHRTSHSVAQKKRCHQSKVDVIWKKCRSLNYTYIYMFLNTYDIWINYVKHQSEMFGHLSQLGWKPPVASINHQKWYSINQTDNN
jgi:hypothetical protein